MTKQIWALILVLCAPSFAYADTLLPCSMSVVLPDGGGLDNFDCNGNATIPGLCTMGSATINGTTEWYAPDQAPDGGTFQLRWMAVADGQLFLRGSLSMNGREATGWAPPAPWMQYQMGIYTDTDSPTLFLRMGQGSNRMSAIDEMDGWGNWVYRVGTEGELLWGQSPMRTDGSDGGDPYPYGFDVALYRDAPGHLTVDGGFAVTGTTTLYGPVTMHNAVTSDSNMELTNGSEFRSYFGTFAQTYTNGIHGRDSWGTLVYDPLVFQDHTLSGPTCASSSEGAVVRDPAAGGSTGHRTRLCLCTSDGDGNYAWQNIVTTLVGTSTTCPDLPL